MSFSLGDRADVRREIIGDLLLELYGINFGWDSRETRSYVCSLSRLSALLPEFSLFLLFDCLANRFGSDNFIILCEVLMEELDVSMDTFLF